MIKREKFVPSSSHRVCSVHFAGGKKTYTNNVPTLNMPMQTKPKKTVRRTTKNSSGERARILSPKRTINRDGILF